MQHGYSIVTKNVVSLQQESHKFKYHIIILGSWKESEKYISEPFLETIREIHLDSIYSISSELQEVVFAIETEYGSLIVVRL